MKLFGIPIKIEMSFFVVVVFLAVGRAPQGALIAEWLIVVFVSILLHEFGHAFAAQTFGMSPAIRLYSLGGQTSWRSIDNLTPAKHLVISLSGPAAGFIVGGAVLLAGPLFFGTVLPGLLPVIYFDLLWVNIGWGLFNLLPILPLDGGQVLITLEEWLLNRKDQVISHAISLLLALTISCWAFAVQSLWIGFLGIWFAYSNGSFLWWILQRRRDQKLQPYLAQIREAINNEETELALELIKKVQDSAKTDATKQEAARLLIFLHTKLGNYEQAEEQLQRFCVLFGEDHYLLGLFHFCKGELIAAVPYLRSAFSRSPERNLGVMLHQAMIADQDFTGALELCTHSATADVRHALCLNLQTDAFNHGQFEVSAQAGLLAYAEDADNRVAYNLACAFARDANPEEALRWLRAAVDTGFSDKEALTSDPDLYAVRSQPEFGRIVGSVGSN